MRLDFIDFPTGWDLQRRIGADAAAHLDRRCSAVVSNGAVLCDCGAIAVEWAYLGGEDWKRYIPSDPLIRSRAHRRLRTKRKA